MILFVVESPNKAKKIRQYFPDFQVIATVGHFRDLPVDRIGVEPPTHKPEYVTCKGKSEIEAKLRAAAAKAEKIYLATDPDREGEAIASHVYQCIGAKYKDRMKRVTYDQISKKAIEQAIAKARGVDWALVAAQEARRVIDRYVGYMVSPVLTGKLKAHNSSVRFLSAGRVQSVTLKLIVERQREIERFKPVEHYGITLMLAKGTVDFTAQWVPFFKSTEANARLLEESPDHLESEEGQGSKTQLMTDKALARAVFDRTTSAMVETVVVRDVVVAPPPPLMTTTFVQMVVSTLKMTTKKAMDIAQKLFEQGLITYHRTDSPSMADEFVSDIRRFAGEHKLPLPKSAHVYKPKDSAQAGHECLRVTDIGVPKVKLSDPVHELVYHLIWLRTLKSQLAAAVDTRTVAILHNGQGDRFISRGSVEKMPGWRSARQWSTAIHKAEQDAEKSQQESTVPPLNVNERVTLKDKTLDVKKTKPPSVYTEKTLVQKLDKLGIGRPSTYAQAIERIVEQHYINRDAKLRLTPTVLGRCVVASMDAPFAFMNYEYTAELEDYLDLIAAKKGNYQELVHAVYTSLTGDLELFEKRPLDTPIVEQLGAITAPAAKPNESTEKKKSAGKAAKGKTRRSPKSISCGSNQGAVLSQKTVSRETSRRHQHLHVGDACPMCRVGVVRQDAFKAGEHTGEAFMGCSLFPNCRYFAWVH
jgi:DNA topoisomerase-1